MKFARILIAILVMVIISTGCGNKAAVNTENKDAGKAAEVQANNGNTNVKTGTNMSLPESFPKSVVPMPDDANIINVVDDKDSRTLTISFTTAKKLEEVHELYKNTLKNGQNFADSKVDNGYMVLGNKENYQISTVISNQENVVNVALNIVMPEGQSDFEKAAVVNLPEKYPLAQFPIYKEDKITNAEEQENDNDVSYDITVISKRQLKDIQKQYETSWNWSSSANKYKNSGDDNFTLQGEKGKISFGISGELNDDTAKSSTYRISLTINK